MSDAEKMRFWADAWDKVEHWAFFVVVIALAVEFAASRFAAPYKRKLDDAKDVLLADTTARAEEAKGIAAKAELAAAEANSNLAQANARAEDAKKEAESFKLEIAKANARAAALEKDAADARVEQERLKAQVIWRSISQAAGDVMVQRLSRSPGAVILAYTANDPEALGLVIQLSKVFGAAHWQIAAEARSYPDRLFFELTVPDSGNGLSQVIREALSEAGMRFSTEGVPQPLMTMNQVKFAVPSALIMVGSKPPPF